MERSIRIGKDFNVRWSIHRVVDGERQPYELAGKELVLQYRTPYGLKEATEWKTEGNTIVWTFRGKEQKALGSYELILTENGGKDGMVTVDTCRAFKLVAHSCEETEGRGGDIVVQTIMLETEVAFAPLTIQTGGGGEGGSYDDSELRGMIEEQGERIDELADEVSSNGVLIEDLQNIKIDKENDDYYPSMAVGLADNLVGVDVVDSEINFRRSGGGAISDGVARVQSIKGNSVVWNNELKVAVPSGVKYEKMGEYSYLITPSGTPVTPGSANYSSGVFYFGRAISNHKYAIMCKYERKSKRTDIADFVPADIFLVCGSAYKTIKVNIGETMHIQELFSATQDDNIYVSLNDCIVQVDDIRVIDLTKMFQAGNEPTTIEEYNRRKPIVEDENAYNEGEVISMRAEGIKSVGVNQWDEQWEEGYYNTTTGEKEPYSGITRNAELIPVLSNSQYYFYIPTLSKDDYAGFLLFYDRNKKYLGSAPFGGTAYPKVTTPLAASYMNFYLRAQYGATYNHDICINLSNADINGKYFPYEEASEDFGFVAKYFPDGMRSAGTAHDEIRYNKATNRWEAVKRVGEVDMGDLEWEYNPTYNWFRAYKIADMQTPENSYTIGNIVCAKYVTISQDNNLNAGIALSTNGVITIVNTEGYASESSFKAAMSGVMLYYELAEPIVTEIEEKDFNLDYKVWNCGTEQMVATEPSSPLSAEIVYGFNAPAKIKENANEIAKLKQSSGSTTTYKTINGTSVVGSGNIDTHYPISSSTASALTIQPNTYYKWSGSTLNVTLGSTDANLCEFVIELSVTGTPSITFPSSVKWANGIAPTFVSGKKYIVSIVNNLGVYAAF